MTETDSTDVGSLLREARERRGMTLREISGTTRISIPVLRALEQNDVSQVPGGIFGRSFVRSYAKEVGLDPDRTLKAFLAGLPEHGATQWERGTQRSGLPRRDHSRGPSMRSVGFVLFSVGLSVLLIIVAARGRWESGTEMTWFQTLAGVPDGVDNGALRGESLTIEIHPTADCRVSLAVDGARVLSRLVLAGEHVVYEARERVVIDVKDAAAFAFSINRQRGRLLGGADEAVTLVIDRANYREYLVE